MTSLETVLLKRNNTKGEREVGNPVMTMDKGIILCSWVEQLLAEEYERPPPGQAASA